MTASKQSNMVKALAAIKSTDMATIKATLHTLKPEELLEFQYNCCIMLMAAIKVIEEKEEDVKRSSQ